MNETRIQNPGLTVEAIAESMCDCVGDLVPVATHDPRTSIRACFACQRKAEALLASPALATLRAHERANALHDAVAVAKLCPHKVPAVNCLEHRPTTTEETP